MDPKRSSDVLGDTVFQLHPPPQQAICADILSISDSDDMVHIVSDQMGIMELKHTFYTSLERSINAVANPDGPDGIAKKVSSILSPRSVPEGEEDSQSTTKGQAGSSRSARGNESPISPGGRELMTPKEAADQAILALLAAALATALAAVTPFAVEITLQFARTIGLTGIMYDFLHDIILLLRDPTFNRALRGMPRYLHRAVESTAGAATYGTAAIAVAALHMGSAITKCLSNLVVNPYVIVGAGSAVLANRQIPITISNNLRAIYTTLVERIMICNEGARTTAINVYEGLTAYVTTIRDATNTAIPVFAQEGEMERLVAELRNAVVDHDIVQRVLEELEKWSTNRAVVYHEAQEAKSRFEAWRSEAISAEVDYQMSKDSIKAYQDKLRESLYSWQSVVDDQEALRTDQEHLQKKQRTGGKSKKKRKYKTNKKGKYSRKSKKRRNTKRKRRKGSKRKH